MTSLFLFCRFSVCTEGAGCPFPVRVPLSSVSWEASKADVAARGCGGPKGIEQWAAATG